MELVLEIAKAFAGRQSADSDTSFSPRLDDTLVALFIFLAHHIPTLQECIPLHELRPPVWPRRHNASPFFINTLHTRQRLIKRSTRLDIRCAPPDMQGTH